MKKNYDPKRLSKKQRHMKKWIPDYWYCHGMGEGKHKDPCPFWINLKNHIRKREECDLAKFCDSECSLCDEQVSMCKFLNYIEYGQYPLGDMCKVCGIRSRSFSRHKPRKKHKT